MEIVKVYRRCPKFHWDHIFGKKISAKKKQNKQKVKLERHIDHSDHTASDGKAKRKNRNDWG